ncbi:hypothetical protein HYY72_00455 [Candidatus Woesearchaeota archaeon]|nr:hypothetical protein [Candidatus Woesearchaeota archaeon]
MLKKKGQSAGGAATLVAAIVGLIILYLLFLPPEDRAGLLGENITSGTAKGATESSRTLLLETPGTIFKPKQDEFEHRISSFNLFSKSEDRALKTFDSVYVEAKSGNKIKKKTFALSIEPSKTSDAKLSFDVKNHKGRLIILLNNAEIFNGEASGQNIISLDNMEQDNVFEILAEDVGFQFWSTNFYDLGDVKVTGTVKLLENLQSKQTFIVGGDEANNINEASLIYFVDCRVSDVGTMRVYLNNAMLTSSVPDCGSPVKIPVDPSLIARGTNTLSFVSERGTFLIDQVSLNTKLNEPIEPIYFFEVNSTQFGWLQNNTFKAQLSFKFVDDGQEKRAELNINNRRTFIDARRAANYTKDITPFLTEGSNFIRIVPEKTLNIAEISIRLQ